MQSISSFRTLPLPRRRHGVLLTVLVVTVPRRLGLYWRYRALIPPLRAPRAIIGRIVLKGHLRQHHRAAAVVGDAAALRSCLVVREDAVVHGERVEVEDATTILLRPIAGNRAVVHGERAPVEDAATDAGRTIASNRAVVNGEGTQVEDAATDAARVIPGNHAVVYGEGAAPVEDAAHHRRVLDRQSCDRHRAAGDPKQGTACATAIDDGSSLSRTANPDIVVDRNGVGVGPCRHMDDRTRGMIHRRLDGGIGAAGDRAGHRRQSILAAARGDRGRDAGGPPLRCRHLVMPRTVLIGAEAARGTGRVFRS